MAGCSFCDSEQRERQTLMETKHFSLLADRQPVSDGHHLIVPRQHLSCIAATPADWDAELAELRAEVELFLARRYGEAVTFERCGLGGQRHAHLHVIPGALHLRGALGELAASLVDGDARAAHAASGGYVAYADQIGSLVFSALEPPRGLLRMLLPDPGSGVRETSDAAARRMRSEWVQHRREHGDGASDVVACFLWRNGQLCLFKRSERLDSAPGRWHIVAGYLPRGSEPLEHARTEVGEETGLTDGQVRLLASGGVITIGDPFQGVRWRIHPFLFEVVDGEPRLNWEHDDLAWVAPTEMARYGTMGWLPPVFFSLETLARQTKS